MGDIVAFSAFESHRKSNSQPLEGAQTGQVLLFTGVRYERITSIDRLATGSDHAVETAISAKKIPAR